MSNRTCEHRIVGHRLCALCRDAELRQAMTDFRNAWVSHLLPVVRWLNGWTVPQVIIAYLIAAPLLVLFSVWAVTHP